MTSLNAAGVLTNEDGNLGYLAVTTIKDTKMNVIDFKVFEIHQGWPCLWTDSTRSTGIDYLKKRRSCLSNWKLKRWQVSLRISVHSKLQSWNIVFLKQPASKFFKHTVVWDISFLHDLTTQHTDETADILYMIPFALITYAVEDIWHLRTKCHFLKHLINNLFLFFHNLPLMETPDGQDWEQGNLRLEAWSLDEKTESLAVLCCRLNWSLRLRWWQTGGYTAMNFSKSQNAFWNSAFLFIHVHFHFHMHTPKQDFALMCYMLEIVLCHTQSTFIALLFATQVVETAKKFWVKCKFSLLG